MVLTLSIYHISVFRCGRRKFPTQCSCPQRETRPYMVDLSIGQLAPDMERAEPINTDTEDTYTTVDLEVPTGTVGMEEGV
jgi:hypothetical protein